MLGVALFHLLPHAIIEIGRATPGDGAGRGLQRVMGGALGGFLAMFFIERFFCYHHHETPAELDAAISHESAEHDHGPSCDHAHDISWSGAALGLTLHSLLEGVAIAAAVEHGSHDSLLAGFGAFLVIFLHKPLDSMTITMLMERGGWSAGWRNAINGLFAMAIPLGVVIFYATWSADNMANSDSVLPPQVLALALAFAAGMFLCVSLSDLLPELQFHQHDRVKLSLALLLGLAVAFGAGWLETKLGGHQHDRPKIVDEIAPAIRDNRLAANDFHTAAIVLR
jgi:zinc and cadmium transporter